MPFDRDAAQALLDENECIKFCTFKQRVAPTNK